MKHNEKNRDPEVARKRAKSDARCALRKLGLLDALESAAKNDNPKRWTEFGRQLAIALGVKP